MLTATYSQIAISLEQNNAHRMLNKLTETIQTTLWNYQKTFDFEEVNTTLKKLLDFNHFCRQRKVETVMIPAVRRNSTEMQYFIAELDLLGVDSLRDIHYFFRERQVNKDFHDPNAEKLLSLMEEYCRSFSKRLEKEELELFPIARQLLSNDDWFCIAVDYMYEEPTAVDLELLDTLSVAKKNEVPHQIH